MKRIEDIAYGEFPACRLDLYLPEQTEFPVMVFFHGGGLESGGKRDETDIFEILVSAGIAVVSADYRMYPQAAYPDFIEDASAAVAWTVEHIARYGECTGMYVGGTSAGAYLSMMLCFDGQYLGRHGLRPEDMAGYIFDSAQPTTHFNVLRERGMDTRSAVIDEAAPIYHIAEWEHMPPMLILVSDNDMPGRLEQNRLLCSVLEQFGYREAALTLMEGYTHTGYVHALDAGGNSIYARMIEHFIRRTQ